MVNLCENFTPQKNHVIIKWLKILLTVVNLVVYTETG